MKIDYAQWTESDESGSGADATLTVDAKFYEILRLEVGSAADEATRFADVAVTERAGIRRFTAGYAMVAGASSGPVRLGLSGPGSVAGIIDFDRTTRGFRLFFADAAALDVSRSLVITTVGFGVMCDPTSVTVDDAGVTIALAPGSSTLVVGGPDESRIRARALLALSSIELLPSY